MAFDEVRFPTAISRGTTGGPERHTEIVALAPAARSATAAGPTSRRRYNAGFGVASLDDIHAIVAFFEERRGRLHGFRWKDHADFKSCAPLQQITRARSGDRHGRWRDTRRSSWSRPMAAALRDYARAITKPVAGSVRIAVDGVVTADFTVDPATGIVTFAAGHPAPGAAVTAGFEFDVPVRFDTDALASTSRAFRAGEIPDIPDRGDPP